MSAEAPETSAEARAAWVKWEADCEAASTAQEARRVAARAALVDLLCDVYRSRFGAHAVQAPRAEALRVIAAEAQTAGSSSVLLRIADALREYDVAMSGPAYPPWPSPS